MKKLFILFAMFLCTATAAFAQGEFDALRDAGDAAIKAKNYTEAFSKYSEYLKATDYKDADRVYNCGIAANQIKNYSEAANFFDKAISLKHNINNAYVGKAMALRNLNNNDEFLKTVEAGLKAAPGNTNLEKILYSHCMKSAQAAQKKGDFAGAEKLFNGVLLAGNKKYQENALYSMAVMFYNKGAKGLKDAITFATTDPAKYKAAKDKIMVEMNKAKGYVDKTLALNSTNANAKKIADAIAASMK